jgi:tetratricopeptide (TPR) repeat protein
MTVRWKPLIVLSGLFLMIALVGLMVVTLDLLPASAGDILPTARAERKAGRYGNAQIHYLRALQASPRDAAVYAELADTLGDWIRTETDSTKRAKLRQERMSALADAAKYGKNPAPARALLADALLHDDGVNMASWARKLLSLVPDDPDAHFALVTVELDPAGTPGAALPHLEAIEAREPNRIRTEWARAVVARQRDDQPALAAVLDRTRDIALPTDADPTDRMARLELREIDATTAADPAALLDRVHRFESDVKPMAEDPETPPYRLVRVAKLVESVQKRVTTLATAADESTRTQLNAATDAAETVAEACFTAALKRTENRDLPTMYDYAEHLLGRGQYDRCLEQADRALASPVAQMAGNAESAALLRQIATKAALASGDPSTRFARAEPYIQGLVASTVPGHRAVGHLFQGVIELERSGIAEAARTGGSATADADQAKLRASALDHLKQAATGLPTVAPAQALYGVALLLTGESGLGRQYLTAAQGLPGLEPRYQLWAAWAMIQAGYPEEAQPIVQRLQAAAKAGTLGPDLLPSVAILTGEVLKSQSSPQQLQSAQAAFQAAATPDNPEAAAVLELRLAEIDLQLDKPAQALERVAKLRASGHGGAAAEQMTALILNRQGKADEALKVIQAARAKYADHPELAIAEAGLNLQQKNPQAADKTLADYLSAHPAQVDVLLFRARVLSDNLDRVDDARKLLSTAAAQSDTSAPLVQLAMLEIGRNNPDAAAEVITRIRARWKEAAVADLLDAQLALLRKDDRAALDALDKALEKDPKNKVALFWKAQLGDRLGARNDSARIYEQLVREAPVKELGEGLSLTNAASWALANLSLDNQDVDSAIERLEGMLQKGGLSEALSRPVRWQLVNARVSKGQWPVARAEMEKLLQDPKTSADEQVRAANLYRLNGDPARAASLLDTVLKSSPGLSAAVALRAYMVAEKQPAEAANLLRSAIGAVKQPSSIYLMLAAVENSAPPADTGLTRALAAIDAGLVTYPGDVKLIEARYRLLCLSKDVDGALRFVEQCAASDQKGLIRRLQVDLLREQNRSAEAEAAVRRLVEAEPDDAALAVTLVGLTAQRAIDASEAGDRQTEKATNDETAALIRKFRTKFPREIAFPQAEAERAARTGHLDQALALSQELDRLDPASPAGPIVRARLAAARGSNPTVTKEYAEALRRSPRRDDIRLALGQSSLASGQVDEALQQASRLIEAHPEDASPIVLKVRALMKAQGTPQQIQAHRAEASTLLQKALTTNPRLVIAYHLMAELAQQAGDRTRAVEQLQKALQVDPADHAGLSQLLELLVQPGSQGQPASPADIERARTAAERYASADPSGEHALAASVAFHRAGQLALALPWAEKAAAKPGSWVAHLNYADLLLAQAEATPDTAAARSIFEQSAAEYAAVLKERANQLEAINNRAWILHQYLGRNDEALDLVQGLLSRVDPSTVPADVFDTLGSIQEALHQDREAEASYARGLEQQPNHPALNLHMARLLATDPNRGPVAATFVKRALAARDQLPAPLAAELDTLAKQLNP